MILVIGNTCIIVTGLISYNNTLKFVPTMEVSGNEKANKAFLTLNMTFRTHSQCIYFSIASASPHHDVMRLKSDKDQNNAYIILAFNMFKRIFRAIQTKPSFGSILPKWRE